MTAKPFIRTLKQARAYVRKVGICLVFADPKSTRPNLWDAVDLPDKRPGEKGWGRKVGAVWGWKNQLPAGFPDEIFYGKDGRGKAVLMTLDYLRDRHYADAHRPVAQCSLLARRIYEFVRVEPMTTPALRRAVLQGDHARRHAFAKALVELQTTLNIVRCNAPEITSDTWVRFSEQYPSIP